MNPDLPSPHDEIDLAVESAQDWYREFDEMDVVTSNHDSRIIKKVIGSGLPSRVMRDFAEIMKSPPGWNWKDTFIEIDGVLYFHGEGLNASSSKTAFNKFKQSVVHGHLHSQGHCSYTQGRKGRYFSINSGALIDSRQRAFDYARMHHERTTLGVSIVIDGDQGLFIPMPDKMQNDFR